MRAAGVSVRRLSELKASRFGLELRDMKASELY